MAETNPLQRRLFVAESDGASTLVTPQAGHYDAPNYDRPLGPWLVLSPLGTRLGYREGGTSQELYVQVVGSPDEPIHVTSKPAFPDYLDNVGPMVFVNEALMCYFAGDSALSKSDGYVWLGAAEM